MDLLQILRQKIIFDTVDTSESKTHIQVFVFLRLAAVKLLLELGSVERNIKKH